MSRMKKMTRLNLDQLVKGADAKRLAASKKLKRIGEPGESFEQRRASLRNARAEIERRVRESIETGTGYYTLKMYCGDDGDKYYIAGTEFLEHGDVKHCKDFFGEAIRKDPNSDEDRPRYIHSGVIDKVCDKLESKFDKIYETFHDAYIRRASNKQYHEKVFSEMNKDIQFAIECQRYSIDLHELGGNRPQRRINDYSRLYSFLDLVYAGFSGSTWRKWIDEVLTKLIELEPDRREYYEERLEELRRPKYGEGFN
jgi:hypothetical protein